MFPSRYFNPRYWAQRYWPKIGGEPTDTPYAVLLLDTPIRGSGLQLVTALQEADQQLNTLISDNIELSTPISNSGAQVINIIEEKTIQLNTWIDP